MFTQNMSLQQQGNLTNKMKTGDSISVATTPSNLQKIRQHRNSFNTVPYTEQNQSQNVIQIATNLVESVANMLCSQITMGSLVVDDFQIPFKLKKEQDRNDQLIVQAKTIDPDEHRRLVLKFKSLNRKMRRQRQMRSLELSERAHKLKQQQQRLRQQSKSKIIQQRRKQIQKRLQEKKRLMKQISKSILQSSMRVSQVKQKKFLYQQKQDQYYNKVILPKVMEQKSMLQKKKQLRIPINLSQLKNHEQSYKRLRSQRQLNRTINIKMMQTKDNEYRPPQFVPESYKMVKQEEDFKKQQQLLKKKQLEIFQLRKKQYIRKLDEIRQQQRQKILLNSHSKSPKLQKQKSQQKIKVKLNREQTKNIGNQYFKQLLKHNKQISTARKLKPIIIEQPKTQRKIRSYVQLQKQKKQRVQKVEQIRTLKIQQILKSNKLDKITKFQKLKYEIQKLDQEANKPMNQQNIQEINQNAGVIMNSIQAKIALLEISNQK